MTYRDPKPEDLERPEFKAVWRAIKTWDINVPGEYEGYCEATGNHVMAILVELRKEGLVPNKEEEKLPRS